MVNFQSPGSAVDGNATGPALRCQQRMLRVTAASCVPLKPDPEQLQALFQRFIFMLKLNKTKMKL